MLLKKIEVFLLLQKVSGDDKHKDKNNIKKKILIIVKLLNPFLRSETKKIEIVASQVTDVLYGKSLQYLHSKYNLNSMMINYK